MKCAARDWRANFFPVGIAHSNVGSGVGADAVASGAAGGIGWDSMDIVPEVSTDRHGIRTRLPALFMFGRTSTRSGT